MNVENEKRRKIAHILTTIINNENLSKLDLRRLTGYSMSTINNALCKLAEDNLIIIKTKKEKHSINYNPNVVIGGVNCYRSKLYGTLMTLKGEIISYRENLAEREDIADAVTLLLESLISGINLKLSAIGISVTAKDYNSLKNVIALRFGVPVYIMDNLGAIAMHQRYLVTKNNYHVIILYIDEQVRCAKVMNECEQIELGSLPSPIISAKRGRLHYNEVLSINTVRNRIEEKQGKLESLFESAIFELEDFSYSKQVKYALGELLLLLDKTLKPKSIIVAGDYIKDELISGSLDTLGDNVRANILCLGNGNKQMIEGAPCIALNTMLYY